MLDYGMIACDNLPLIAVVKTFWLCVSSSLYQRVKNSRKARKSRVKTPTIAKHQVVVVLLIDWKCSQKTHHQKILPLASHNNTLKENKQTLQTLHLRWGQLHSIQTLLQILQVHKYNKQYKDYHGDQTTTALHKSIIANITIALNHKTSHSTHN